MSSAAPEGPIEVLTVYDKTVSCEIAKWPTMAVPSSAIYAKAHWRVKALLFTDRMAQVGFAKVIKENAPKHATPEYLVFCRVSFPPEGEDPVAVPDIPKNERGRYSGPVFFNPPADLPVGVERYEEIPHELYGHVSPPSKIDWPSVLRRRNHRTGKDENGEEKSFPILPSYLYDERVRYEKWKVAILTWWQSARESRVGSHRLMRWQNVFQSFRRDFPSFPANDAGAVRRFSSVIQAYERELEAGRSVAIKSDLAPEDQHNRPAVAGAAGGSKRVFGNDTNEAEDRPIKQKPVGPAISDDESSSSDDDDGPSDDEDAAAAAKSKTAGTKAAMAAARARLQASDSSSSDSDSDSDSESEEEVKSPSKKRAAVAAPAPVLAPAAAAKKRAAPVAASSSESSSSESESESEDEAPAPASKRAPAAAAVSAAAAAKGKGKGKAEEKSRRNFDDSDSDSDSEDEVPVAKKGKQAVKSK